MPVILDAKDLKELDVALFVVAACRMNPIIPSRLSEKSRQSKTLSRTRTPFQAVQDPTCRLMIPCRQEKICQRCNQDRAALVKCAASEPCLENRAGNRNGVLCVLKPMVMSRRHPRPKDMGALRMRRQQQTIEGAQAMLEYIKTNEAVRERLARLRAERQARQAQASEKSA